MDTVTNNSTGPPEHVKEELFYVTLTLGWVCTAAWSLSFYPQVFMNWKRKSVVGLSFDFIAFDFVGFIVYSTYIISLLWIPKVKAEYEEENEDGVSPVQTADVVFSLHALLLTTVTLLQCIIYDRGGQKVSEWTRIVLVVLTMIIIITLIGPAASSGHSASWTWLNSVSALSYIKVVVTVLKYWPQVLLNYRRKSTEGWSVHNVLLDFVGGWLSLVQMFIEASVKDTNQWPMTFENIAKYWLCVITLVFDSVFLVQHYALYSRKGYQRVNGRVQDTLNINGEDTDSIQQRQREDEATVDLNGRYRRRRDHTHLYAAEEEEEDRFREVGLSENQGRTVHTGFGTSSPPLSSAIRSTAISRSPGEIADDTLLISANGAPHRYVNYGATATSIMGNARLETDRARARQNSHASDDVSINSSGPDFSESNASEFLSGENDSTIENRPTGNASNTLTASAQQTIRERQRAELAQRRRELQALGIHFNVLI